MFCFNNRLSLQVLFFSCLLLAGSCKTSKEPIRTEAVKKEKPPSAGKLNAKYAGLMGVDPERIVNSHLYSFIDTWYGTPYKYGGKSRNGIDCSNFTSMLYKEVYNKNISGSSAAIFEQCTVISRKELKEGDLVFFKIGKNDVSHLGVYLMNNKFVHATTKKGVMIDDLEAAYYKTHFYKAGRFK